jgi:RNA polymerase primary sigma factor
MVLSHDLNIIVDELYALYKSQGFIREEEARNSVRIYDLSLADTERLIGKLLGLGVIFVDGDKGEQSDDDDVDYSHTDYESIFSEALSVAPGMESLINYIRDIRPPQRGEWRTLLPQAKAGNKFARDRVFEMYLRVVLKITLVTNNYNNLEFDDRLQEGALGLLKAIQSYDFHKHGSFVSYFPLWVIQYIDRASMDKGSLIRIPVHVQEVMIRFKSLAYQLTQRLGRLPSLDEIACEMDITLKKAEQIRIYFNLCVSLDNYMDVSHDGYINCVLVDKNSEAFIEEIENCILREIMESMLNTLPERESAVLRLRYGFEDGHEWTLEEIGTAWNVTRERIRQINSKSLQKLQRPIYSSKLLDFSI